MSAIAAFVTLFLGFLSAAAICDLRSFRIPNRLTAAMAGLGPVAVWAAIPAEGAVQGALLAGATTFLMTWAMFEIGLFGGGDAKLLTAAALWLGGPATLAFALATALFGAVLAAALLMRMRLATGPEAAVRPAIPYAVAMAPAGVAALIVRLDGLI